MSSTCRTEEYGRPFHHFVLAYEKIRYAGSETGQDKQGLLDRFVSTWQKIWHPGNQDSRGSNEHRPSKENEP